MSRVVIQSNSIRGFFRFLAVLILFSSIGQGIFAQAPSRFYTRFGGNGHDIGYGVKQTLDGHYIVTGSTSSFGQGNTDVYLVKVDSMGWPLWQKAYGGFNNDIGQQVVQLADSGFVVAGYTNSQGNGGYDVYLLRTDKNGTLLWQKTFGGMDWDFAYDLKQTADNGFLICGSTQSSGRGKTDGYIIKTDANGILQWSKTYGGAEDDEFRSLVLTYNNLYAFAGTTKSYGDTNGDVWLFKTDLNGDSVLHVKYGDNKKQNINDLKETSDKGFILCGGTDTTYNSSGKTDGYMIKFDQFGNFVWWKSYGLGVVKDDQCYSMCKARTIDDNYVYVRKTDNGAYHLDPNLMLLDGADNYKAQTSYGSTDDDELFRIENTRDKGYILCGYTKGFGATLSDVYLLKLDSTIFNSNNSAVSVSEISAEKNKVFVFPTITYNEVTISSGNDIIKAELQNNLGQTIYSSEKFTNQIDLSVFSTGVYYLSLITKMHTVHSFKIVKIE